ncbi:MAG: carbohydrate ABC transporter permease [Clostridiales bacterium]|nr:carbohydrate ABC transporter permease [Clostridiales bacterium]
MSENGLSRSFVKKTDLALKIVTYIVSIGITALVIAPFVTYISGNFIDPAVGGEFSGASMSIKEAFGLLLKYTPIPGALKNSLIVSVTSTVLCVYVSAITAYSLVAYEWKFRRIFNKFIIIVMMIPSNIAIIGYYQLVWKFHLANRLCMVIFPAITAPLAVYFMKLYLEATFSRDILESARMDGAGEIRIFNKIILPLMKPALATQAIFIFLDSWTEYVIPGIVLVKDEKRTLPIMSMMFAEIGIDMFEDPAIGAVILAAITLVSILPPIILFAFLSKDIVEGVQLGSVKY